MTDQVDLSKYSSFFGAFTTPQDHQRCYELEISTLSSDRMEDDSAEAHLQRLIKRLEYLVTFGSVDAMDVSLSHFDGVLMAVKNKQGSWNRKFRGVQEVLNEFEDEETPYYALCSEEMFSFIQKFNKNSLLTPFSSDTFPSNRLFVFEPGAFETALIVKECNRWRSTYSNSNEAETIFSFLYRVNFDKKINLIRF
jgi:hypothetical protein